MTDQSNEHGGTARLRAVIARNERRQRVWKDFLDGMSIRELSQREGVGVIAIRNDIHILAGRTQQIIEKEAPRLRAEMYARVSRLMKLAIETYERSCSDKVETTTRTVEKANGQIETITSEKRTPQAGDVGALRAALKAVEQMCSLLGLNLGEQMQAAATAQAAGDIAQSLTTMAEAYAAGNRAQVIDAEFITEQVQQEAIEHNGGTSGDRQTGVNVSPSNNGDHSPGNNGRDG